MRRSAVGVAVYPRLGELLRASNLTVAELERQIEEQYGLAVDPEALHQLADGDPVQRADLEVAGAAAMILGVGLDELFTVEAAPILAPRGAGPRSGPEPAPGRSARGARLPRPVGGRAA